MAGDNQLPLSLLEQHLAQQTVALVEARDRLNAFCVTAPKAVASVQESINKMRASLPGEADAIMKNSAQVAIGEMAAQVVAISQQIAGDSAAASRAESFTFVTLTLTILSSCLFGFGIYIGTLTISNALLGGISVGAGVACGIALGYSLSMPVRLSKAVVAQHEHALKIKAAIEKWRKP